MSEPQNIIRYSYKLLKSHKKDMKRFNELVGHKGFGDFSIFYSLIFLDIFMQLLIFNF